MRKCPSTFADVTGEFFSHWNVSPHKKNHPPGREFLKNTRIRSLRDLPPKTPPPGREFFAICPAAGRESNGSKASGSEAEVRSDNVLWGIEPRRRDERHHGGFFYDFQEPTENRGNLLLWDGFGFFLVRPLAVFKIEPLK